jgi:hypothetical protein
MAFRCMSAPAARADQVQTDPNSPTSKEYAILLDSSRHRMASSGGVGTTLLIVDLAAAALLLCGLGGFALRRRTA